MTASPTNSVVRDTATFFVEGNSLQFHHVLNLYPQVLKLKAETKNKKPEELIKLDYWYQNELPKQIKARGKDAHCSHEELVQLMKWKQARGKFYPQLNYLVKVNTPRAVMNETKKAFKKLPNLELAITALSNLKGVGTTMASALLAAAAPEIAPFMADECLLAIPDIEGIDYTTKEYLNFVSYIQNTAERLSKEEVNGKWNPHSVELALWTHFVACELKPELLDNIPVANGSSVANNNHNDSTDDGDISHQNGSTDKSPTKADDSNVESATATDGIETKVEETVADEKSTPPSSSPSSPSLSPRSTASAKDGKLSVGIVDAIDKTVAQTNPDTINDSDDVGIDSIVTAETVSSGRHRPRPSNNNNENDAENGESDEVNEGGGICQKEIDRRSKKCPAAASIDTLAAAPPSKKTKLLTDDESAYHHQQDEDETENDTGKHKKSTPT